jgi:hypothetical protein
MNRSCRTALRAAAVATVVVSAFLPPAFGYGRGIRDDQIPYGPEGTIGRGTDHADPADPSGRRYDGSGYFSRPFPTTSGYFRATPAPPPGNTVSSATRPYRTTQYYDPGTGTRYPLYYSPATRTYFYYLAPPR